METPEIFEGEKPLFIFSLSFQVFVSNLKSDKLSSLEISRSVYVNSAIFPLALLVLIASFAHVRVLTGGVFLRSQLLLISFKINARLSKIPLKKVSYFEFIIK